MDFSARTGILVQGGVAGVAGQGLVDHRLAGGATVPAITRQVQVDVGQVTPTQDQEAVE